MDKYFLPINYIIRVNNEHYDDTMNPNDHYQKEVYVYVDELMKKKNLSKIIDIGCGSGFKLIKYLGKYETTGFETEPCISYLRKTYPLKKWIDSGKPEVSFSNVTNEKIDVIMASDVIEHIRDPDSLINFMKKFNSKYYLFSTPCRQRLFEIGWRKSLLGPPENIAHVREWTFNEFKSYLSIHFDVIDSKLGIDQIECQWHLCVKK